MKKQKFVELNNNDSINQKLIMRDLIYKLNGRILWFPHIYNNILNTQI